MIILDTNVVSELMRLVPEPAVRAWTNEQAANELHVTAITAAELLYGVARLPVGRKQFELAESVEQLLTADFDGRVLAYDLAASREHASLLAARERAGRPMPSNDAQIASVCLARRATLATRNTKDFEDTGIELINPWEQE